MKTMLLLLTFGSVLSARAGLDQTETEIDKLYAVSGQQIGMEKAKPPCDKVITYTVAKPALILWVSFRNGKSAMERHYGTFGFREEEIIELRKANAGDSSWISKPTSKEAGWETRLWLRKDGKVVAWLAANEQNPDLRGTLFVVGYMDVVKGWLDSKEFSAIRKNTPELSKRIEEALNSNQL